MGAKCWAIALCQYLSDQGCFLVQANSETRMSFIATYCCNAESKSSLNLLLRGPEWTGLSLEKDWDAGVDERDGI
jgi:hypothetical protein